MEEKTTNQNQPELQERLDEVNDHFRMKAAHVMNQDADMRLLAHFFTHKVLEKDQIDLGTQGESFAALCAASLCQIGATGYSITQNGLNFVQSIIDATDDAVNAATATNEDSKEDNPAICPTCQKPLDPKDNNGQCPNCSHQRARAIVMEEPSAQESLKAARFISTAHNVADLLIHLKSTANLHHVSLDGLENLEQAADLLRQIHTPEPAINTTG